jgi:FkbM family methyltransferase
MRQFSNLFLKKRNEMFSILINTYTNSIKSKNIYSPVLSKLLLIIRRLILKFIDPEISVPLGKKKLYMNLSHMLPIYQANHVLYDTALPRIVKYINSIKKNILIVDVGANIGDTAALLQAALPSVKIICVEGDDEFIYFLDKNFSDDDNVNIEKVFLSDSLTNDPLVLASQNGTARLTQGGGKNDIIVDVLSLDKLMSLKKYNNQKVDLIKIDTDGFDYKIIRGSLEVINNNKPMIYFELVPSFLLDNDEDIMSIFDFLKELTYQDLIIYDNLGYPLGLFSIHDKPSIKMIIDYLDYKNMYLDILVSCSSLNDIYFDEMNAVNTILNMNKEEFIHGYVKNK